MRRLLDTSSCVRGAGPGQTTAADTNMFLFIIEKFLLENDNFSMMEIIHL
jgi:hypothetical protein